MVVTIALDLPALLQPQRLRVFARVDDVLPLPSGRAGLLRSGVPDDAGAHAATRLGWVIFSLSVTRHAHNLAGQ